MFVSITFHPNRGIWRSLFATETDAATDVARFLALGLDGTWARVEPATADDAARYVGESDEAEGEQRGEYGSGAVSLGYDGSEAMMHYDGYRTSDDPVYVAASRFLAAQRPMPTTPPASPADSADIPF